MLDNFERCSSLKPPGRRSGIFERLTAAVIRGSKIFIYTESKRRQNSGTLQCKAQNKSERSLETLHIKSHIHTPSLDFTRSASESDSTIFVSMGVSLFCRLISYTSCTTLLIHFITPIDLLGDIVAPLLPLVHQILALLITVQLERIGQRAVVEVYVVDAGVGLFELGAVRVDVAVFFELGAVVVRDVEFPAEGGDGGGEDEEGGGGGELHFDGGR